MSGSWGPERGCWPSGAMGLRALFPESRLGLGAWWQTGRYFSLWSLAGRGVLKKGTPADSTKPSCLPGMWTGQACQGVSSPSQSQQQALNASSGMFRGHGLLCSGGLYSGLLWLAAPTLGLCPPSEKLRGGASLVPEAPSMNATGSGILPCPASKEELGTAPYTNLHQPPRPGGEGPCGGRVRAGAEGSGGCLGLCPPKQNSQARGQAGDGGGPLPVRVLLATLATD